MGNFLSNFAIDRVKGAEVAAATDVTDATEVDMQGWDGVVFVALLGALTATQNTRLQAWGSNISGATAALTGAATVKPDDADVNPAVAVDVFKPIHRYMKPVLKRATANAVLDGIIAIRYRGSKAPVTQGATIVETASVVSPALV